MRCCERTEFAKGSVESVAWHGIIRMEGKAKKDKTCSISPSRVVPHRSTTDTRGSLTSLFGWEAVTLPDVAARGNYGRKVIYKASTFCNALPSFTSPSTAAM